MPLKTLDDISTRQYAATAASFSLRAPGIMPLPHTAEFHGGPTQVVSPHPAKVLVIWPESSWQRFPSGQVSLRYEQQLLQLAASAVCGFLWADADKTIGPFAGSFVTNAIKEAIPLVMKEGASADKVVEGGFRKYLEDKAASRDLRSAIRDNREMAGLSQDRDCYENFVYIALQRLRQRISQSDPVLEELPAPGAGALIPGRGLATFELTPQETETFEMAVPRDASPTQRCAVRLAVAAFHDFFKMRFEQRAVILASPALPPFLISFFGSKHVAGLLLATSDHARQGHLQNTVAAAQFPVLVSALGHGSSGEGWADAARRVFDGRYAIMHVGENLLAQTNCQMLLSGDRDALELKRREIESSLKPVSLPSGRQVTRDNFKFYLSLQVSSIDEAKKFEGSLPVGLAKSEFLFRQLAYELGKRFWDLSDTDLRRGYKDFLTALAAGGVRDVNIRVVDYSPDKLWPPDGWNKNRFLYRQLRELAQAVRDLDKKDAAPEVIYVMIPDLKSEKEYAIARRLLTVALKVAKLAPDRIGLMPMIESEDGIEVLKRIEPPDRVAVGMGDFARNKTGLERKDPELLVPDARIIAGLRSIRNAAEGAPVILCGGPPSPANAALYAALRLGRLALAPAECRPLTEILPAIDHPQRLLKGWEEPADVYSRAGILIRYWEELGVPAEKLMLPQG